jgi:hypothetical protein
VDDQLLVILGEVIKSGPAWLMLLLLGWGGFKLSNRMIDIYSDAVKARQDYFKDFLEIAEKISDSIEKLPPSIKNI